MGRDARAVVARADHVVRRLELRVVAEKQRVPLFEERLVDGVAELIVLLRYVHLQRPRTAEDVGCLGRDAQL
jgi:hypothetical protein